MRVCELTRHLTESEDPDLDLFELLLVVLQAINDTSGKDEYLLLYYQLKLANILGFAPAFDKTEVQRITGRGGFLAYAEGTITSDPPGNGPADRARREVLRFFAVLSRADLEAVLNWSVSGRDLAEVHKLVEKYLKYHVADAYPVRGSSILHTLYKDTANQPLSGPPPKTPNTG